MVNIWQKLGYGLGVKRKKKYLYNRKCNEIKNNSKKRNSGKQQLDQSYKYLKQSMDSFCFKKNSKLKESCVSALT